MNEDFSVAARTMLAALNKTHLRDVSEAEFTAYLELHPRQRDTLRAEYCNWTAPSDAILMLLHAKDCVIEARRVYWRELYERADDPHVKANALAELKRLEG